jgi:Transcriptional regulator/sugar kinase
MEKQRIAIGVDIGGTSIRVGIVGADGVPIGIIKSIPTNAQCSPTKIVNNFVRLLGEVWKEAQVYDIQGIGIGCTGPIDNERGIILDVANLPTLKNYPLKDRLLKDFKTNIVFDNDANDYILGEAVYGAGQNASSVLGFTLGTGLGCAFVDSGKIKQGTTGCFGEIWTSPYKDGIIEDYVSGKAISKSYNQLVGKVCSATEVAELARKGNRRAVETWNMFAADLAYVLSWTVNMTDPAVVVLGGSLVKSADLFLEKTDKLFRQYISSPLVNTVLLKTALLGDYAGVIGAALSVINSTEE